MAYKDGIVNSVIFSKTTPKILWILKEVNHNGDLENWNFTKILQDLKTDCGIEKGFERTFAPIVHLSYGIINKKTWSEVPYHYDEPDIPRSRANHFAWFTGSTKLHSVPTINIKTNLINFYQKNTPTNRGLEYIM